MGNSIPLHAEGFGIPDPAAAGIEMPISILSIILDSCSFMCSAQNW